MPTTPNDYPVGAIILDTKKEQHLNKILKVCRPHEKDGPQILKQIGNFGLDVLAKSEDGYYLINLNGKLTADTLDFTTSLQSFKAYIRPYSFTGTSDDLEKFIELVLEKVRLEPNHNLILIKDFVGLYENKNISFWIFEDRLLISKLNGQKLASPQHVIFHNNNLVRVGEYWIYIDQQNINKSLVPVFKSPLDEPIYTLDLFLKDWLSQIKNKTLMYALLGWSISSLFLEHINSLRKSRFFPFFVITAATEAGKTTLLSNCIKIFGVNYIGENFASSVTRFVEMIEFARVSHIPIWRDEYKNEKYTLEKEGWLRSVYTRSSASRGDKDQNVRQYPTNATLLLSGEDITEDSALSRRMIKMRLSKHDKIDKAAFENITHIATTQFPKVLPLLISAPFSDETFLEIFNDPKNYIMNDTLQRDELMCYAAIGAIFGKQVALEAIKIAQEYHALVSDDIINERQVTVDDFFTALDAFFLERGWYESQFNQKPKVLDYFYFPKKTEEQQLVYLRFAPLFMIVTKNRSHGEYKWSKRAIGQLITEAYNTKTEPRRFYEDSARVMIIEDYEKYIDPCGEVLQKIAQVQKNYQESRSAIDNLEPLPFNK